MHVTWSSTSLSMPWVRGIVSQVENFAGLTGQPTGLQRLRTGRSATTG